jgi:hypothetical protein
MSYNDQALYEAGSVIKNCLDALLKPIVGINHGRNAPVIQANNNDGDYSDYADDD